MPEIDSTLIAMDISHYRALLKLNMDAETRSTIEHLLGAAARDLVRAKHLERGRAKDALRRNIT